MGTLWFGDPAVHSTEGNIAEAEEALKALGVGYTTLTAKEIEEKYHFRNLPENYTGLFQADGASINFKATIEALLGLCKQEETVHLEDDSPVLKINQIGERFEIHTPLNAGKQPGLKTEVAIVGAGTSGLYTAYRLVTSANLVYKTIE